MKYYTKVNNRTSSGPWNAAVLLSEYDKRIIHHYHCGGSGYNKDGHTPGNTVLATLENATGWAGLSSMIVILPYPVCICAT